MLARAKGVAKTRGKSSMRVILLAGAAAVFLPVQPALAQVETPGDGVVTPQAGEPGIGEIIVTARRREENIQDVPVAITAITAEDLVSKQIVTQNDLKFIAPSLSIQGRFGHQGGTYAMRGLAGPTSGTASVGTYFAEVPSPQAVGGFDVSAGTSLYDLESVQVLKGPQGTLFGRTSTAGAVLITPSRPSLQEFSGNANVAVGSLGRTEVTIGLGGPIVEDVLAVRFAVNRNHRNGYTKIIGTDNRLDESDSRSYRASVEFAPLNWLRNSTIYEDYRSDSSPGAFILSAYNPGLPQFNLPGTTPAFNAVCANAVAGGYSPNVATCVAQRLTILAQIKGELAAEVARTSAGGSALRSANTRNAAPYREISRRQIVVNTTALTLPSFGKFEWNLKNIFGYQRLTGYTLLSLSSNPTTPAIQVFGAPGGASLNQSGNQIVPGIGLGFNFYTNETQLSGSFDDDRLVWVAGYYYQNAPLPTDTIGLANIGRVLGGVTSPTLGYTAASAFPIEGGATQKAYYAQATVGLDGLIDGLRFTGGFRHSKDKNASTTAPAVLNLQTGAFAPSATRSTVELATSGTGYNFSIDYKLTPDVLLYVATRRGYVPGGLNTPIGNASGLANYSPIFGSETITDYEIGAKADFDIGNLPTRLNIAYYTADYSNIQRIFTGFATGGAVINYTANVAAAKLSGVEAELTVRTGGRGLIGVNYSYNDTGYTSWEGADPLNLAPAGTILDLSNNPFPNAAKHKLSVNASYDIFQSATRGAITLSGSAYTQSREWFSGNSRRFLDVYGENLKEAISQKSYALFNAKIDWNDLMGREGLSAGLFVRNITDKIYTTSGIVQLNTIGTATKTYAEPRSYGLNMSYQF